MSTRNEMFHSKPYTKCLDCITSSRIKCNNCMGKLINDINQENAILSSFSNQKLRSLRKKHSKRISNDHNNNSKSSSKSSLKLIPLNLVSEIDPIRLTLLNYAKDCRNGNINGRQSIKRSYKNYNHNQNIKCLSSERLRVTNNFQYWIEQNYNKKQLNNTLFDNDNMSVYSKKHFLKKWPKKTKKPFESINSSHFNIPKFQKWQKKLIQILMKKVPLQNSNNKQNFRHNFNHRNYRSNQKQAINENKDVNYNQKVKLDTSSERKMIKTNL